VGNLTSPLTSTDGCTDVIEVAHPRHAQGLSAAFSNIYSVGSISWLFRFKDQCNELILPVASWTTFGCLYWYGTNWNWRLPALGQALGGLVQLIAMPFMCVPRCSPRD
jgi:hypothetical protein